MQKTPLAAWLLLLLLSTIWGSSFILIKKGLVGLSSDEVGSLRIVSAFLFLLPVSIVRFKSIPKNRYLPLLSVGFLGSLIPSFLFATAQTQLESATTGLLNGLTPIFTVLIATFLLKQRQSPLVFLGIAIGFLGMGILITGGSLSSVLSINSYAFLVVLATICYASNLILIKQKLNDLPALTVTSISLLLTGPIACIQLFGFTDFGEKLTMAMVDTTVGISIAYICILGILGTAIAMIIFNRILQLTNALFASSVTYIIPAIALFWGFIDGEQLSWSHFMGMVAIASGVYIINASKSTSK